MALTAIGRRGLPGLAAAAAYFVAGIRPARPEWMTDVEPTTEPVLIIDVRTYRRDAERVCDAVERMNADRAALYAVYLQNGIFTRDEVRRLEGFTKL